MLMWLEKGSHTVFQLYSATKIQASEEVKTKDSLIPVVQEKTKGVYIL